MKEIFSCFSLFFLVFFKLAPAVNCLICKMALLHPLSILPLGLSQQLVDVVDVVEGIVEEELQFGDDA